MTQPIAASPATLEHPPEIVGRICDAILSRQRFVLTSHARPDGDSIGSQLAMAYALEALGKEVRLVNADAAPEHYFAFPGVERIEIAADTTSDADAVIVMECSDLTRTGVAGLEDRFLINIDHHAGNRMYGAINWFDESAAACGEMVFDVIKALGVPLTEEIATHIYLAILTDTGSFHHSNITPRTFDICRQTVEAGVNPAIMARRVYDSNSFGKLKLIGALLDQMVLVNDGRAGDAADGRRRCSRRAAARTTTPRGSSTCRSPRGRSRRSCSSRPRTATACGSACARSTTSTSGWSRASSAAAATRTPPASPCRAGSPRCRTRSSRAWSGRWTRGCSTRPTE